MNIRGVAIFVLAVSVAGLAIIWAGIAPLLLAQYQPLLGGGAASLPSRAQLVQYLSLTGLATVLILFLTYRIFELLRLLLNMRDQLEANAIYDPLTGLLNRTQFLERVREEINRATRHRQPLTLLLFSLDHSDRHHPNCGPIADDAALKRLASILKSCLRTTDLVGRLGNEEFAAVLIETPLYKASLAAERLRISLHAITLPSGHVTASLGLAPWLEKNDSLEQWLIRADHALYLARKDGGDCVAIQKTDEELAKTFGSAG